MNKLLTYTNILGFKAFMLMFSAAFIIGTALYNIFLKPLLAVLYVAAEHMPDDFGSETVDDTVDKAAGAFASFVDNHVFSRPKPNYETVPDEEYKANFKF